MFLSIDTFSYYFYVYEESKYFSILFTFHLIVIFIKKIIQKSKDGFSISIWAIAIIVNRCVNEK